MHGGVAALKDEQFDIGALAAMLADSCRWAALLTTSGAERKAYHLAQDAPIQTLLATLQGHRKAQQASTGYPLAQRHCRLCVRSIAGGRRIELAISRTHAWHSRDSSSRQHPHHSKLI